MISTLVELHTNLDSGFGIVSKILAEVNGKKSGEGVIPNFVS